VLGWLAVAGSDFGITGTSVHGFTAMSRLAALDPYKDGWCRA
jgi:hypothetical protein